MYRSELLYFVLDLVPASHSMTVFSQEFWTIQLNRPNKLSVEPTSLFVYRLPTFFQFNLKNEN